MVAATESTAVRSFGREQPELEGDLGLENSNGVLWLTAAEAVDFDLPVASSKRKKSKEEPKRAAGRPRSEEHTSELQSLMRISYAVFCLKKKNKTNFIKD